MLINSIDYNAFVYCERTHGQTECLNNLISRNKL